MKVTTTYRWIMVAVLAIGAAGCRPSSSSTGGARPPPRARIAASNSYVEAAIRDLLGVDTPVLRLTEPGTCPGHFDIRPSQVNDLRDCRLLVRFDFQGSLDSRLSNLTDHGLAIRSIKVGGGMCEPSSYTGVCEQVAEGLVAANLVTSAAADARMSEIKARIAAGQVRCRQQIKDAGLTDIPVLCSAHQEAFCRTLGLQVAATFGGADITSVGDIERAIKNGEVAKAQIVIANLPEGVRVADALAQRLKIKRVVFGNFPSMTREQSCFDALVTDNVNQLIKAMKG